MTKVRRVALAYSGGLDTSVMIPWLRERRGCDVVAVIADVGQREDLEAVRRKALATGAVAAEIVDLRTEFVRDFAFAALRAGAVYEGRYLLGTALARPAIARAQVGAARRHGCDALAHGCTGKGNDQVRFELAYQALAPDLSVMAPWREWEIRSREDALAYAAERRIPVPASRERPYSVDRNLWHTSFEGGALEDAGRPALPCTYDLTVDPVDAPEAADVVAVDFRASRPTALDGVALSPVDLLAELNRRAGAHGVGREDMVENRVVGMKSRGVYETPGGTALMAALRDLEAITLDGATAAFKESVARRYAELAYQGLWYSPLREALDAFLEDACAHVTGRVTLSLYKGGCRPVARSSPVSLYRRELATFGEDSLYDQADAAGFIRLWGLPARVHAAVHGDVDGPDAEEPGRGTVTLPDMPSPPEAPREAEALPAREPLAARAGAGHPAP